MNPTLISMFIAIITLCGCFTNFKIQDYKTEKYIEMKHLERVMDFCTDAAVDEMIDYGDVGTDYSGFEIEDRNMGYIRVNPTVALKSYIDTFLMSYNMSLSDENRHSVMSNNMPVFMVAAYDGYYIAKLEPDTEELSNSSFTLNFSPKLPYSYTDSDSNVYALTLSGKEAMKVKVQTDDNGNVVDRQLMPWNNKVIPGLADSQAQITHVNEIISSNIATTINEINDSLDIKGRNFYVPGVLSTMSGVNPIKTPTVMAIMQNVDYNTGIEVNATSIAGTRINTKRQVACYLKKSDGQWKKMYCYSDRFKENNSDYQLKEVVDNIDKAAQLGYNVDWENFE